MTRICARVLHSSRHDVTDTGALAVIEGLKALSVIAAGEHDPPPE